MATSRRYLRPAGFAGLFAFWGAAGLSGCGAPDSKGSSSTPQVDASTMNGANDASTQGGQPDTAKENPKVDAAAGKDTKTADAKAGADAEGAPSGAFFGEPRCPQGSLFCEDFETDLDPKKWETMIKNGTISVNVDGAHVARGKSAVHFKILTPTGERGGFVNTAMPFPLSGTHIFVRYFMYIEKLTPDRWYWVFAASDDTPWFMDRYRDPAAVGEYGLVMLPNSDPKSGGSPNSTEPYSNSGNFLNLQRVPLGQWVCWEFEYRGENGGEMIVYRDEKQGLGNDGKPQDIKGWPAPLNPKLYFGVYNSHDDEIPKPDGFNVWVDGIAVSREKIGCTK